MTLVKKAGKESSTRWVADRDRPAGPRMCGPRDRHSWTLRGCGGRLHPTAHTGRLPLLGAILSLSITLPSSFSLVGSSLQMFKVCHPPQLWWPLHIQIPRSEQPPLYLLPCSPLETLFKPCPCAHLFRADSTPPASPPGWPCSGDALPASPLKPDVLPSAFRSGSKERSYVLIYLWFPKSSSEPDG